MQPKKTQRKTHGPNGLYELFLLTVPIEEVVQWQQYETVLIIFPQPPDNHHSFWCGQMESSPPRFSRQEAQLHMVQHIYKGQ